MKLPFLTRVQSRRFQRDGFTLVEVLLSSVLLLVIVLMVVGMINAASKTYRTMNGQVSLFQESSVVFDNFTRSVASATLKTYLDYYPDQSLIQGQTPPPPPTRYVRNSDLHFITGPATQVFQSANPVPEGIEVSPSHAVFFLSPLDYTKVRPDVTPGADDTPNYNNTSGLLTGCGYYVAYNENASLNIPGFNGDVKRRFRLMRFFDPTEDIQTYSMVGSKWFLEKLKADDANPKQTYVRSIADNVIGLFIEPKVTAADLPALKNKPLSEDYNYDSRVGLNQTTGKMDIANGKDQLIQQHQLPPLLHVTMVVIDEPSAARLATMQNSQITTALFDNAPFTSTKAYEDDMVQLNKNLNRQRLNYRVFSSDVPLRGAKWSPQ